MLSFSFVADPLLFDTPTGTDPFQDSRLRQDGQATSRVTTIPFPPSRLVHPLKFYGNNTCVKGEMTQTLFAFVFFQWWLLFVAGFEILDHTVAEFNIRPNGFTVTSFIYNSIYSSKPNSDWVDRMFGSKSVFYTARTEGGKEYHPPFLDDEPLTTTEQSMSFINISSLLNLPPQSIWPRCSIEILGFVKLGVEEPFLLKKQFVAHVGKGRSKPLFEFQM